MDFGTNRDFKNFGIGTFGLKIFGIFGIVTGFPPCPGLENFFWSVLWICPPAFCFSEHHHLHVWAPLSVNGLDTDRPFLHLHPSLSGQCWRFQGRPCGQFLAIFWQISNQNFVKISRNQWITNFTLSVVNWFIKKENFFFWNFSTMFSGRLPGALRHADRLQLVSPSATTVGGGGPHRMDVVGLLAPILSA